MNIPGERSAFNEGLVLALLILALLAFVAKPLVGERGAFTQPVEAVRGGLMGGMDVPCPYWREPVSNNTTETQEK